MLDRRYFLRRLSAGGVAGLSISTLLGQAFCQDALDSEIATLTKRLQQTRGTHPSLHFDAEGRDTLRKRAAGTHRKYAKLLYDWVEQHRNWVPPVEFPDRSPEFVVDQGAAFLTNVSLAFVLSGRQDHLELARRWTLAMCELPRKEFHDFSLGMHAAGLARAYDWLYDEFSTTERQRIRDHVAKLTAQVYVESIPSRKESRWWAKNHLHHDYWLPVGGYGEAALGLLGDVEEAALWAARAKLDFDFCFTMIGDDGAWHEGAAEWCLALDPLLWFYGAWQTAVGENLHDNPWLKNTAAYRLYHWLPDDTYVHLNDSFRSGRYGTSGSASCHLLRRFASLFKDRHAQWLADRDETFDLRLGPKGVFKAPYEGSSYRAQRVNGPPTATYCAAWNMLWYDPDVKPKAPDDLPTSRHFPNAGIAILRTGWDQQAVVASLACGPLAGRRCAEQMRAGLVRSAGNFFHTHADYNAFTLFCQGEYFLIPPGYARRASHFQNTISVNGADFLPDASLDIRTVAFRAERGFSYAVGDATDAFVSDLEVGHYRRHLLLLDSGWCVLFDELRLRPERRDTDPWNRFQWTAHHNPIQHDLSVNDSVCTWRSQSKPGTELKMYMLQPDKFAWERSTFEARSGAPMLHALRLTQSEWYSQRMHVLAAFDCKGLGVSPTALQHPQFHGVLLGDKASSPAVAFALEPLDASEAMAITHPKLHGRELLLFGTDPDRPGHYLSVKNG